MNAHFATEEQIQTWNELVSGNPDGGNMFQATGFIKIKSRNHWTPRFAVIDDVYISILERKIPILGNFWYIPKGPGVSDTKNLGLMLPNLLKFAKENNVFLVKIEPEIVKSEDAIRELKNLKLKTCGSVQVPSTIIVDTSDTIDNIVGSFSPKTRANIRSAQKSGVQTEVVPINDKTCAIFYEMMTKTIKGRAHMRSLQYYKDFWKAYAETDSGVFLFAKFDNKIISTDFVTIIGKKGGRKDAASDKDHIVRGASALLEVAAIEYLKSRGVTQYDLCGSPPSDQIKNQNHPYYGFGTFKAGFNSNVTDYIGCRDLIVKPNAYMIWNKFGEKIMNRLHKYRYNDLYY